MKAPTSLFDRPGRATAVVGAVVAISATAAVALLAGTATATPNAAQSGKCTKNVNVRAEPDTTSRIVALCEQGTAVQVAESRDGFLRLTNLGGWAAQEYISVNGRAPTSAGRATNSEDDDTEDADDRRAGRATDQARENGRSGRHGGSSTGESSANESGARPSGPTRDRANDSTDESSTDDSGEATDPAETDESESGDSGMPGQDQAPRSGGIGGLLG
jgi:Bacterial SH3 domain